MREEITNWIKQAEEEYDTSKLNLKSNKFFAAAFFSQQATEASLKALYIYFLREKPPDTHNLINLLRALEKKVEVPVEFINKASYLNPHFIISRYPDAAGGTPFENYTKDIAETCVKISEEFLEWAKNILKKK